jgi:tetratricopeptide (TPR) repeat protein
MPKEGTALPDSKEFSNIQNRPSRFPAGKDVWVVYQNSMNGMVDEGVDMRSNRLRYHKSRAKIFYNRAEVALNKKMIANGFALKFETAALYFYQASVSYRASSKWREAGDALCRCASLYQLRLKSFSEAAALYTEASEAYSKVDNNDTMKCLTQAISIYCDLGVFSVAGRLQRQVADLHRSMRHFEEAAEAYRKAADFLSTVPGQSDLCLEKSADCFIECGEYQLASDLFELLAESCAQSNLKFFQAKFHLFHAVLCQLAMKVPPNNGDYETKYAEIRTNILRYESIDITWRCSKQAMFLLNVIAMREAFDQHGFADHLYYYFTVYSFSNDEIAMLRVVSDEIVSELERQIEERKRELREATKKQRKKALLLKKRRQLRERGLNPFTVRLEDIQDSDEEEGEEGHNGDEGDDESVESSESDGSGSSASSSSSSGASEIELPDELKEKEVIAAPRRRRGDPTP